MLAILTTILLSCGSMVPPFTTRRLNLLASSCHKHISVWPEQNGHQHPTRAHLGIALPYFVKPSVQRASEFQKVLTQQGLKLISPKFQWLLQIKSTCHSRTVPVSIFSLTQPQCGYHALSLHVWSRYEGCSSASCSPCPAGPGSSEMFSRREHLAMSSVHTL